MIGNLLSIRSERILTRWFVILKYSIFNIKTFPKFGHNKLWRTKISIPFCLNFHSRCGFIFSFQIWAYDTMEAIILWVKIKFNIFKTPHVASSWSSPKYLHLMFSTTTLLGWFLNVSDEPSSHSYPLNVRMFLLTQLNK